MEKKWTICIPSLVFCAAIILSASVEKAYSVDGRAAVRIHRFDQPVVKITSGVFHTVAVKKDGRVEVWGSNEEGALNIPKDLDEVIEVAAGRCFSVALKKDGTLVAWGDNSDGQCKVPEGLSNVIAVAAGYQHVVALKKDGSVVSWGGNKHGQTRIPALLGKVKEIAACFYQSFAIKEDGTLIGWGYNFDGQTQTPRKVKNVLKVSSGASHTLALLENGKVIGWGLDNGGQSSPPADLSGVVALASSSCHHSLALKSDGRVAAWGGNGCGQTIVPADLNDVVAVSAGWYHSTALKRDGVVYEWGRYNHGPGAAFICNCIPAPAETEQQKAARRMQVFAGLSLSSISAGAMHSLAVKKNGAVVAWGSNRYGQCRVPAGLSDVVMTAGGRDHSLALKKDGAVIAWGRNHEGQAEVPAGLKDVVKIYAGDSYSGALKRDGSLVVWGRGNMMQSLVQTGIDHFGLVAAAKDAVYVKTKQNEIRVIGAPAKWFSSSALDPVAEIEKIWAGAQYVLAQTKDGHFRVVSPWWQMNPPTLLSEEVMDIKPGYWHCMVLKKDGTVAAWGSNREHQCDIPPNLSNVVMIAAGEYHSLSLSADGTLSCWGKYEEGQLNAPVKLLKDEDAPKLAGVTAALESFADLKKSLGSSSEVLVRQARPKMPQPLLHQITSPLPAYVDFGNVGTAAVIYAGLIHPDEVTLSSAATEGFLSGTLSSTGVFSSRLSIGGWTRSLVACFGKDGQALFNGKPTLTLADQILTLKLQKDGIFMRLVRGQEVSQGLAVQALYDDKHIVPEALVALSARDGMALNIPPTSSLPGYTTNLKSEIEGRASMLLSRNGNVYLFGAMGDGTPLSTSSILISRNKVPLYLPFRSPMRQAAAFSGTLNIDSEPDDEQDEKEFLWYRQPEASPLFPINP